MRFAGHSTGLDVAEAADSLFIDERGDCSANSSFEQGWDERRCNNRFLSVIIVTSQVIQSEEKNNCCLE
jgi:hypothetical protein